MSSQHPSSRHLARPLAIAVALGLGLAGPLVVAAPAFAATTWTVTVETDVVPVPDVGSLRWAVAQATSGDTITFDTATVDRIDLTDELDLPKGITIDGPGTDLLTIGRANTIPVWQFGLRPDVADQDYTIRNLTIEGGPAGGAGIAIYSSYSNNNNLAHDITLSNVVVQDESFAYGAALNIYNLTGDLVVDDSLFENNHATVGVGGAFSLERVAGDITITNSQFVDNSAALSGGAVDITDTGATSEILIRDTEFTDNRAGSGGGLAVRGANVVELSRATFDSNGAQTIGGAALIGGNGFPGFHINDLRVEDSLFIDNRAGTGGGGLSVDNLAGTFDLEGTVFNENISEMGNGGGISIDQVNDDSVIFGSTFVQNDATEGSGGGVYLGGIANASLGITDSSFYENRSLLGGGGLAVDSITGGGADGLSIASSTFARNDIFSGSAGGSSIAIQTVEAPFFMAQVTVDDPGASTATGAVFIGNVNRVGGGLAVGIGSSTIVGPGGVRIFIHTDGDVFVTHTILDSLSPTLLALGVNNPGNGFQLDLRWSLLSTGPQPYINDVGGNTFNVADMGLATLANNGGPTETRMPLVGSPALDAGDPTILNTGEVDQRETGFLRVIGRMDIGAVELQTLALAATGATVNWWLLGGGIALLVLGAGALIFVRVRRRSQNPAG